MIVRNLLMIKRLCRNSNNKKIRGKP